jgi:CO/xanthine dehydrogenase Mo-binding subunit
LEGYKVSESKFSYIGKRIKRVDSLPKVTGQARYYSDIRLPNMLVGKILTSPFPHAKIINIDTSKAEQLAGVRVVLTRKDMPKTPLDFYQLAAAGHSSNLALALDKVRFLGEEVAAVAAENENIAEEALKLIDVEYEVLDAVFDPVESMKAGAPSLYAKSENKIAKRIFHEFGDVDITFKEADYVFDDEFKIPFLFHGILEPQGCICKWDAEDYFTIWTCTQTPHLLQWMYSTILEIPIAKCRVISPYLGGGFGARGHTVYPYAIISAILAKKAGRPVKIEFSREKEFTHACTSPQFIINLKTAVNKEGKVIARQAKVIVECGAHLYSAVPQIGVAIYTTFCHLYKVPNIRYEGYVVYTNNPIKASAFRGFGGPQMTFAIEAQMDMIAEKLDLDPVELKLMNLFEQGETSTLGWEINSYGLPECINKAAEASDWNKKRKMKIPNRGIGMACALHQTAWRGAYGSIETSSAIIIAKEDGSFSLFTDFSELGTGVWTVAQAVAAELIGCRLEDIQIVAGDTSVTPFDLGSYASRGTYSLGNAVKIAAIDMRNQLFDIAANMLGVAVEELEARDGKIFLKNNAQKNKTITEVSNYAHFILGKLLISKGIWNAPTSLFDPNSGKWPSPGPTTSIGYTCQVAEVEVDTETGKVKVLSVVSANDVGYPINLTAIEGQIDGGIMMALGFSLTENMRVEQGEVLTRNFSDFFIRGTLDIPKIKHVIITTNDIYGPFGAKGVGEVVGNPIAAAVSNAIYNAVGIRIKELPMTPEKILHAIKKRQD